MKILENHKVPGAQNNVNPAGAITWFAGEPSIVHFSVTIDLHLASFYATIQRWSPRGRPWPRGHILKSLALASNPQVLENCPVLGSRTALFFEQLKFCWKTPETLQKIFEHLFCFPHLEHRRSQGEGVLGVRPLSNWNFTNDKHVTNKPIVSSVSVSF